MGFEREDQLTNTRLLELLKLNVEGQRVILIKEDGLADSNFLLSHVIKNIFAHTNSRVYMLLFHNNIGHYHNVGTKLGYDLLQQIKSGKVKVTEFLKVIADNIGNESNKTINLLSPDKEYVMKQLFQIIKIDLQELCKNGEVYMIIDDLNHLLDLNVEPKFVVSFVNYCLNLWPESVKLIISTNVSKSDDGIVCNALNYLSDVVFHVAPLKTGISHEVSGVINIKCLRKNGDNLSLERLWHYKVTNNDIKVFIPGECINMI